MEGTVGWHKLDHLAIYSTTAVGAEARVNPAFTCHSSGWIYGQVVEFVSAHGTYFREKYNFRFSLPMVELSISIEYQKCLAYADV